uniref:Uncharacterized protein n=1 Tax=Avena sativa TaxID=4498 RepID=A0ACD5UFY1_AVESA
MLTGAEPKCPLLRSGLDPPDDTQPESRVQSPERRALFLLTPSTPMCCYVGKATKIFLCLLTALLLAGLVLGFGLARRTLWGAQKTEPACRWPRCSQQQQPLYGDPIFPATATTPPPPSTPLTEPAVAVFPGFIASSTAVPPAAASVPVFGPPSPFSVGPGPSSRP